MSAPRVVWLGALVLAAAALLSAGPARAAAQPPVSPAEELAARYAPVLYVAGPAPPCADKGEPFYPVPVETVLGDPRISLIDDETAGGPLTAPSAADLFRRGADAYLDYPGNPRRPGCTYDRDFRALPPPPAVAYAHVVTEGDSEAKGRDEGDGARLALQYWFFTYFNDADNTHEGDWEMIQLSWDVATVEEAFGRDPARISYAQHGGGETAEWGDEKVRLEDGHPVVFTADGSHASYFAADVFLMYGEAGTGLGCDDAAGPARPMPLTPILVPTEVEDQDDQFAWLAYEGRWGERQGGFWNGPTGPNTKERWREPLAWEDGLRDFSYRVGGDNTGGLSPVNVFCSVVSFGGAFANLEATNPLAARAIVAAAVALLVGGLFVARRTLAGAARLVLRYPVVFGLLGLTVIPAALALGLLQLLVVALPPVEFVLKLTERSPATVLLQVLSAGALLQIPVLIFVGPAISQAVADAAGGRPPEFRRSVRAARDRLRVLAGAAARVWLPIAALVVSVVGAPLAVVLAVRWAFAGQAVVLDGAASPRRAVAVSAGAVRGGWWRAFVTLAVLGFLGAVLPPLLGVALMFRTDWSLAAVTTVSGLVAALAVPFVVVGTTLLYRDLGARSAMTADVAGDRALADNRTVVPRP